MEVVNGLDELEARELVVEQGSEYRFHHELVKRVVYEALSHYVVNFSIAALAGCSHGLHPKNRVC